MDEERGFMVRGYGSFQEGEEVLVLERDRAQVRVQSAQGYTGYVPKDAVGEKRPTDMKRFLLFAGKLYYPSGGWGDFVDSYGSLDEAEKHVRAANRNATRAGNLPVYDWHEVVDTESWEVVAHR